MSFEVNSIKWICDLTKAKALKTKILNILLCTISRFWTNGQHQRSKFNWKIPGRSGGRGFQSVSIKLSPKFSTYMALLMYISRVIKNNVWKPFGQSVLLHPLAYCQCQWPHIFRKSMGLINDMMIGIIIHNAGGWAAKYQISKHPTCHGIW